MREDYVIVLRTDTDHDDIIGLIIGNDVDVVRVQHPYYIKYDASAGNIVMMPYCALTDESFFEFKRERVDFLVTASKQVSTRFLQVLDRASRAKKAEELEDLEMSLQEHDNEEVIRAFIEGNDTRH